MKKIIFETYLRNHPCPELTPKKFFIEDDPFQANPKSLDTIKELQEINNNLESLPFEDIWMESSGDCLSYTVVPKTNLSPEFKISVLGIRIKELDQGHLFTVALEYSGDVANTFFDDFILGIDGKVFEANPQTLRAYTLQKIRFVAVHTVSESLKNLNLNNTKFEFAESSYKSKTKVGNGPHKKEQFKIKDFIIVKTKGFLEKSDISKTRTTEYSHGWWVKGHWRNFEGIGKDRHGNRVIKGKTWVLAHTKNDDLGVVDKIRVIKKEDSK